MSAPIEICGSCDGALPQETDALEELAMVRDATRRALRGYELDIPSELRRRIVRHIAVGNWTGALRAVEGERALDPWTDASLARLQRQLAFEGKNHLEHMLGGPDAHLAPSAGRTPFREALVAPLRAAQRGASLQELCRELGHDKLASLEAVHRLVREGWLKTETPALHP